LKAIHFHSSLTSNAHSTVFNMITLSNTGIKIAFFFQLY
jgi:hypothetical protein